MTRLSPPRSFRFGFKLARSVVVASLALAATAVAPAAANANKKRPPNIVLIVSDDLGYADVGFNGGKDVRTPNLDRLADNGIRSTNAYVTAPQCSPTRAGLMTGIYQQRFGYEHIAPVRLEKGLPTHLKIMPAYLREAGYYTGMIGKWHLGHTDEYRPERRGFDEFYGFLGGGHSYLRSKPDQPPTSAHSPLITPKGELNFEEGYLTDMLGREAAAFIERNRDRPFFLYVPFNAPHVPIEATSELESHFTHVKDPRRRTYLGMILALDRAVGRIVDQLATSGIENDTLVIFTSDNGAVTGKVSGLQYPAPRREGRCIGRRNTRSLDLVLARHVDARRAS